MYLMGCNCHVCKVGLGAEQWALDAQAGVPRGTPYRYYRLHHATLCLDFQEVRALFTSKGRLKMDILIDNRIGIIGNEVHHHSRDEPLYINTWDD